MNLSGMGAAGMDEQAKQIASSSTQGDGSHQYGGRNGHGNASAGPGPSSDLASNAGLITSMANM